MDELNTYTVSTGSSVVMRIPATYARWNRIKAGDMLSVHVQTVEDEVLDEDLVLVGEVRGRGRNCLGMTIPKRVADKHMICEGMSLRVKPFRMEESYEDEEDRDG